MPTDANSSQNGKKPGSSSLVVELVTVISVVTSLLALTFSVYLFMQNGGRQEPVEKKNSREAISDQTTAEVKSVPVEPLVEPEIVISVPESPDDSLEKLVELNSRLKSVREQKAKADLMAWIAEKSAGFLENRIHQTKQNSDRIANLLTRYEKARQTLDQNSQDLADLVARLELEKEDSLERYEAAKNRKGFSILPYRGPSGTWHRPIPIECSRDVAQIMPGGPSFRLIDLELSGNSRTSIFSRIIELAMRKAASQATPDGNAPTVYVLFVVRPSGIKAYYEARTKLQTQGVAFGYELVDEETLIDYPDLGDLTEWPGYVAPQETLATEGQGSGFPSLANQSNGTSENSGGRGLIEGNAVNGNPLAKPSDDGLYVWKNGLGGTSGHRNDRPGSPDVLGSGGHAGFDSEGSLIAGMVSGSHHSPSQNTTSPVSESGEVSGALGRQQRAGNQNGDVSVTPRVDFGQGTLSQFARGRSGFGVSGSSSSAASDNPQAKMDSASGDTTDLTPPWGQSQDPRRPYYGNLNSQSSPSGSNHHPSGTFDNLIAELKEQGHSAVNGLDNRPNAVPILPEDLLDSTNSRIFTGNRADARSERSNSSSSLRQGSTGSESTKNPFGSLPKFESVESAFNENPSNAKDTGTASSSSSSERRDSSQTDSSRNLPPKSPATRLPALGADSSNAAQSGSSGNPSEKSDREDSSGGLRSAIRRIFNKEERLPEKSWEVSIYCDADGITIRPGEHRMKLVDLNTDPDLLPRTLQAMFENQLRDHPERYWRPYIRYRIGPGGENLPAMCQTQLDAGFVRWPAIQDPVASSSAAVR